MSKKNKFWLIVGFCAISFLLIKLSSDYKLKSTLKKNGEIVQGVSLGRSPIQFSGSSKVTVINYWVNNKKYTMTTSKGMYPKGFKGSILLTV